MAAAVQTIGAPAPGDRPTDSSPQGTGEGQGQEVALTQIDSDSDFWIDTQSPVAEPEFRSPGTPSMFSGIWRRKLNPFVMIDLTVCDRNSPLE